MAVDTRSPSKKSSPQLSDEEQVVLIPFQLEELAVTEGMIQEDGLHPTALAQPIIKEVIKDYLEPLMNSHSSK